MTGKDKKYLSDIEVVNLIEEFISSIHNYNEYLADLKTQSAVERQLGIIGEAVNKYDLLLPDATLLNAKRL